MVCLILTPYFKYEYIRYKTLSLMARSVVWVCGISS